MQKQPLQVTVYSDFVCPWCYMGHVGAETLKAERGVEVTWKSYELRPPEAPPLTEAQKDAYRQRIKAGGNRSQEHARTVFGLEMKPGRPGTPSRLAHAAAKWAVDRGKGEEYRAAVFSAHWKEDRDISQVETLKELATAVGLDAADLEAALNSGEFVDQVLADENEAVEYGINGVPAFVFADRYLVSGAQPPDVLLRIADKVVEELEMQEAGAPVS